MRKTGIATICDVCNEEFELFSDDNRNDSTVIWNCCPFCGAKKELWLRFIGKSEEIELGIGSERARIRFPFQKKV